MCEVCVEGKKTRGGVGSKFSKFSRDGGGGERGSKPSKKKFSDNVRDSGGAEKEPRPSKKGFLTMHMGVISANARWGGGQTLLG